MPAKPPSKLQQKAALRADQLITDTDFYGMSINSVRAREAFMGSNYATYGLSAQTPARKLGQAQNVARATRATQAAKRSR